MKITLLSGAARLFPPLPIPPIAATSYFIPRLHNRLFVSRFIPEEDPNPRAATFPPTGRRIRRGDGEKVSRGYRKPSCPSPSLFSYPSRARFALEHLFVVRVLSPKTTRSQSTSNELIAAEEQPIPFYLSRLTLNSLDVVFILNSFKYQTLVKYQIL